MPELPLPGIPEVWAYYADWRDLALAAPAAILITLLIIWWRQQTRLWFRVVTATLLAALVLSIASAYLFVVPPHYAGCPAGCDGWSGYPLPVALVDSSDEIRVGPLDFALNLLMLWLLWLGASLVWQLLGVGIQWWDRSLRSRVLFVFFLAIVPWALLPRVLDPPQPRIDGEELRLAINAQRAAEFTYRITGVWVQRLAVEDIRFAPLDGALPSVDGEESVSQVCLRGYTYFYFPWRRYRINLDPSGVTAISLNELPLAGSCWD